MPYKCTIFSSVCTPLFEKNTKFVVLDYFRGLKIAADFLPKCIPIRRERIDFSCGWGFFLKFFEGFGDKILKKGGIPPKVQKIPVQLKVQNIFHPFHGRSMLKFVRGAFLLLSSFVPPK